MTRFLFSLRFRILLIVFLAVLPALLLVLRTGFELRRMAVAKARDHALSLVHVASMDYKLLVQETHHFLIALAERSAVRNGDRARCSPLFAGLLRENTHYTNIGLIDLDGRFVCSAIPAEHPVDVSDRSYFRRVLETRELVIGDFQVGRISGKASLTFAYPVLDAEERVEAVVVADLDLAWLNDLGTNARLPDGATLTLLDSHGIVMAHYPNPQERIGKSFYENGVKDLFPAEGERVAEVRGSEGRHRFYACTDLAAPHQGTVCLGIPKETILSEADYILRENLVAVGGAGLLALIAAWGLGQFFMMRKIDVLVDTSRRLAEGDLGHRTGIAPGRSEIRQLAQAFDEMADRLQLRREERDRMEDALRQSEAKFRTLVEQIPAITYVASLDSQSTSLYVSPQSQTILGFDEEDYRADPDLWRKRLHPEDRDRVMEELARCHADNELFVSEYRMIAKDDRVVWFRDEARVVRDESGLPLFLQGVMVDITEQKRTSEALRESEALAGIILENISDTVFITDDAGGVTYVSPGTGGIFGLSPQEVYALGNISRLLGSDLFDPDALKESGELQDIEREVVDGRGKKHALLVNVKRVNIKGGTVFYTCRDISVRKRMENALRRARDELELRVEQRTAELAALNEELRGEILTRRRAEEAVREAMEKLKFFAYSVMHDLKSPSIAVHGLTNLLKKRCSNAMDEKSMLFCDQIIKASEHVAALVDKINVFIATKESPLVLEAVSTREIFGTLMEEFSAKLTRRRVSWVQPEEVVEVRADRMLLLRALRNYVDNALKYGGERLSEIRIGYEESESVHIFSVSDNGEGVTGKDSEKIFEMFHRNHTSRGIEGAGLGLAIVREIAEQHGGKVWMRPRSDQGSIFYLSIAKDLPDKDTPAARAWAGNG
ncbi:MAG TPA: PAS domain S-box protein [Syntrophobacteraceae bacterium]|nr:PAS domain S-box protein [Syntrophobacteraceae bacterium]